jgi:hypothetical protein
MAFPFPLNPVNGQQVTYTNNKGRDMVATYNSVKNEWEVETIQPPAHTITSTPEFNVLPTADGQSVVWDDVQKKWVAKKLTYKTTDLTDVSKTVPTADQILKWNDGLKVYQPADLPGSDIWKATSNQVGGQAGATDADKVKALYLILNPGKTAKEGEVILVSKGTNPIHDGYVGSWFYDGAEWVLGASGGGTSAPKPTINYRGATTTPQTPGVLAGDLDVVTEANNKQLNVYDGTNYQRVLGELEIKQWIAAGSLFQGAIESRADIGTDLPAPATTNKGFYWTWTGPASTNVALVDFTNGGGFIATLQVGDWIQSDGTKFVHVPSDLLSKLRWEGIGSFKTWADKAWEKDSLVIRGGRYYRANQAVVPGDAAPETAGSKWADITPRYTIDDLTDVNAAGITSLDNVYLAYNQLDAEWQALAIKLNDLSDVVADKRSNNAALEDNDVLFFDNTTKKWRVDNPAAVAKLGIQISDLKGVTLTALADQHFLVYDGATNSWKNTPTVRARLAALADVGDVEIAQTPEVGQGLAWTGNKWVPKTFGGMDEWKAGNTYAQNSLVLHKNSIWQATAEILPGNEPGGTNADSGLWKKELNIRLESLSDVTHTNPTDGQALIYNAAQSKWVYANRTFADLTDSTITTPTNGQTLVYENGKWVNKTPTVTAQTTVGDIKQSILTEVQFKAQMGADGGGWVLADGRNVSGSTYATITGQPNVPDLRGAYLRMAGQSARDTGWNGGALSGFTQDTTRLPREQFTTSDSGSHRHIVGLGIYAGDTNSPIVPGYGEASAGARRKVVGNVGTDFPATLPGTNVDGSHTHTIGGGDAETRPKTYSVNYYIKIN